MKPEAMILILNRFPSVNSSWYEKMQIKSIEEYKLFLDNTKFKVKTIDTTLRKGWISVTAIKPVERDLAPLD